MKKLLFLSILGFITSMSNAQIAEVKQENGTAKIYNESGNYSGYYISMSSSDELSGFNNKYVVVTDGRTAKIYDAKGNYTGNYISLCSDCYVKNVSGSAILIKESSTTKYYDFKGNYTGNYTN